MPRRLVCSAHDTIAWEEFELPESLPPGHVRVRNTHGAEKHGTKVAFVHGYGNKRGQWDAERQMFLPGGVAWDYPIPLGNMQVGLVEQVAADVASLRPGDRVLTYGAFAPVSLSAETETWKLGAQTSWKAAVCLDPAVYALSALRDGRVRLGDAVAIFSLGAIGLMAVQLARAAGCYPIIAIDPLANRREVALKTGADHALDPFGADVGAQLRAATGGRGVDAVIEYSGTMEALQASLRGVAFGGNIVLGGFPGPMKPGLDLGAEAHMNRPNIIFSRAESEPNREHPRWNLARLRSAVHHMIFHGRIDGEQIVNPVLKFGDDLANQYDSITSRPENGIKLGVEY